jgi:hypothetical protein
VGARGYTLKLDGGAVPVHAVRATASLFPLLGISPALGRTFSAEEEVSGRDRVVVLSHCFGRNALEQTRAFSVSLWSSRRSLHDHRVMHRVPVPGRCARSVGSIGLNPNDADEDRDPFAYSHG